MASFKGAETTDEFQLGLLGWCRVSAFAFPTRLLHDAEEWWRTTVNRFERWMYFVSVGSGLAIGNFVADLIKWVLL